MHIRKATNSETNYILNYALDVMKEATMGKVKPLEGIAQQIMKPVLAEGGYYLVCVENKTICGWIGVGETYDFFTGDVIGMIPELYVLPNYRRQGIAAQLCQTACKQLKKGGCQRVQLNVFAGNRAKKLYEDLGFNDVSTLMERKF